MKLTKKIFFTGGNSNVGKGVIPLLERDGYKVVAPSSKELNLIDNRSVREYFDKNGFEYDAIVHAAVLGGRRFKKDDLLIYFDNMRMFENIFSYSYKVDRFIHFNSGASLYGSGLIPNDPYGFSKYCMARSTYDNVGGINLNIFASFGPDDNDQRFLTTAIQNYIKKEPIVIFQDKLFDFFYVKDLYKILKYSLDSSHYHIGIMPKDLDCVYDRKYYLSDIAEMINGLGDYKVPIIIQNEEVGKPYCGSFGIDLNYIGLEGGLIDLYESLRKRNI